MIKQRAGKMLIVGYCIVLLFSLTIPGFASSPRTAPGKIEFQLPDGRVVKLDNKPEELVMGEDKDRHFRRIHLKTSLNETLPSTSGKPSGKQQDNPGNLFGTDAEKMIPGDQAINYMYIDSVDVNKPEIVLGKNEELIAQGGVVYLISRLPASSSSGEKETDTYGVEAYNEELISEELLHRSLINVSSEIYQGKESSGDLLITPEDKFWDIEKYASEQKTKTMRVDGCPYTNAGKSTYSPVNETFQHVHSTPSLFESEPIFMGFVSDEYGVVANIRVKVPLDIDNRFDKVEGRVLWEFYYVPGNIIEKEYPHLYEGGTDTPDKEPLRKKELVFIPDEEPAKAGPNIVLLGKTNPLGDLPQTGGGVEIPFVFSTFQTILFLVGIMLIGFLLLDYIAARKKKKKDNDKKTEEP